MSFKATCKMRAALTVTTGVFAFLYNGNSNAACAFVTELKLNVMPRFLSSTNLPSGDKDPRRLHRPLQMSTTAPPPIDAYYESSIYEDLKHRIEIVTPSVSAGTKKKTVRTAKRRKIRVRVEEVERMRKATSSSVAINSPTKPVDKEAKKIKKTPRMITVTDTEGIPLPALSIPYINGESKSMQKKEKVFETITFT
jgi:hypothetical protein